MSAPFGTILDNPLALIIGILVSMGKILLLVLALLGCGLAHASPTLLVFGDSLSAAYGIDQQAGWVALLQERLRQKRLDYTVINASVSGETTSGGAARIAVALAAHKPAIVVVALGANDGLRGLPLGQMRDNLAVIVRAVQKFGSRVLLVGMKMPPNYGPQYTRDFEQTYVALARQFKCALAPFLLDGVAGKRELFLDDNLHPNAQAQPVILENVWKGLAPMLK
jgi:acyl-CoA thioesterase-1